MGIKSLLGLGSSSSSSGESGSGTSTRTSGMSTTGWHRTDAQTALRHHREAQAPVGPAGTDRDGRRVSGTLRNFGRPYRREDGGVR
ncbi:hypothetical protein ACWGKU_29435 [Kitasatospora sp. NPDC054768]